MARVKQLVPYAILAAALGGLLAYAHPGYMSWDSIEQLHQARAGQYSDWHPPAMAALWRLVEHVWRGPLGMLLLQSATFVAGAFLLLRRWLPPLPAAIATMLVTWFPPIATTLAVIWKDSQLLGYGTLGVALLATGNRRAQLAALAVLALASAMRHNAFTVTVAPVVLLFAWPGLVRWRRYAVAAGAWLAITAVGFSVNVALTDERKHPWTDFCEMTDLVGMLYYAPPIADGDAHDLLADTPFVPADRIQERIAASYDPRKAIFSAYDLGVAVQPTTDVQRAAIDRAWKRMVADHPLSYLETRADMFGELMRWNTEPHQTVWVGIDPIGKDLYRDHPTPVQRHLRTWALDVGTTAVFWPWVYLAAALALTVPVVRTRDRVLIAVVASALTSELPLFLVAPTADFRYSIWLVSAVVVGAISYAATVWRRRCGPS
jgi:hypothetical protein